MQELLRTKSLNKHSILLISTGQFEENFLRNIAENVAKKFQQKVDIEEKYIELSLYYDPMRRQYNGYKLLKEIDAQPYSNKIKKIAIFQVDLFIPILTYIFGQATFNGNTGIASLYRLRNELYGLKKDNKLMFERFCKVIIHELGHTFGLIHCHTPSCVMNSSTYVEDLDQKESSFCPLCNSALNL